MRYKGISNADMRVLTGMVPELGRGHGAEFIQVPGMVFIKEFSCIAKFSGK